MSSTKYEGLSYPTHFLKVGIELLGIIFLNTELNKLHFLRNDFYLLFASSKAKHMSNRHFSCTCNDTIL